jgi:hypothetical protein
LEIDVTGIVLQDCSKSIASSCGTGGLPRVQPELFLYASLLLEVH